MKRVLIAALIAASFSACAETAIFRFQSTTVRLLQSPCIGAAAAMLKDNAKDFKQAAVTYEGREFGACWKVQGEIVLILDDEGDGGSIPLSEFKPEGA
jgi:hypothetical protein